MKKINLYENIFFFNFKSLLSKNRLVEELYNSLHIKCFVLTENTKKENEINLNYKI